jgi:hypothetical protein
MLAGRASFMDWLQFIDGMVGHLAWPVVAAVLIIVLRKHIGALAERLTKLSFGGVEFAFKEFLAKGEVAIEEAEESPKPLDDSTASGRRVNLGRHRTTDSAPRNLQGYQLWRTTAAGQIISSYEEIERLLNELARDMDKASGSTTKFMHFLVSEGKIAPSLLELYQFLKAGRNVVAHAKAMPSSKEVAEYVRQASYLTFVLDALLAESGKERKTSR